MGRAAMTATAYHDGGDWYRCNIARDGRVVHQFLTRAFTHRAALSDALTELRHYEATGRWSHEPSETKEGKL